jgi:SAM-dependent methyltransferase
MVVAPPVTGLARSVRHSSPGRNDAVKNKETWKPGKFILTKQGLKASRDRREVSIGSRFICDIQAAVYERAIRRHARGVLLDLGCGKVPLYELYRDYVTENICVDWVETPHKSEYFDYEYDLNREIPLADNQFDTILATDVLEHIANPDCFWHEVARLVKPGGKVIIGAPFLYWLHEEPYDFARYSEYRLTLFCEQNGLTVVSLEAYGGSLEVVLDIIAKHLKFSRILSAVHLMMSKAVTRLFSGRKFINKTARRFPLGYCLVAEKPKSLKGGNSNAGNPI